MPLPDEAPVPAPPPALTHVDAGGALRQVDVSAKPATLREAVAESVVRLPPAAWEALRSATLAKGDALAVARLAGIAGAKFTPFLIPLCHAIPLGGVEVLAALDEAERTVTLRATARTHAPTGVEMEAMTAASVAALALYDMVKGVDKGTLIQSVRLVAKSGGKSGDWRAT